MATQRRGPAFNAEIALIVDTSQGNGIGDRCRLDTGYRANPPQGFFEEAYLLRGISVSRLGQTDDRAQYARRLKAPIQSHHMNKAADQQPRGNQQLRRRVTPP